MQEGLGRLIFKWAGRSPVGPKETYFIFFPAMTIGDFPAFEFAVAETFGLTCLGFFASLLPRRLSPLDIWFSFYFMIISIYEILSRPKTKSREEFRHRSY
ncbi:MAG: hypothetical protein ACI9XZ_004362 [Alphaproteobacteria bacterium]|jgi:hypothetical protein